ncbi:MAG: IS1182 family transposase [Flavobacteriaceae bacterium]|nr:IS1182 family transposase [Flavobacteriaceae bacterium]
MSYIQGFNRKQAVLIPETIEQLIAENNPVRFIDAFVNSLAVVDFGFKDIRLNKNGRPPFHPKDLLKLYIYGYLNKIRSSRALEKECKRNIELMWLIKGLVPDHNTISNFRRDNPKAIKKVFRATVSIAKNLNLIGGILLAGDGTKLRAQNSKKNNYNQKKIDRHLAYIENKLAEYCKALETADGDNKKVIETKIDKQNKHKAQYKAIEKQLKETGDKQVSTSDPESRQLVIRGVVTEVCYNVQSTVDEKFKLPIDYQVTNNNDKRAMTSMVENAIEIVGNNTFNAIFDKGYYTAEEIHKTQKLGVTTHVCVPNPASHAPDKAYDVSQFIYNKEQDNYTCPAKQTLKTNGNWYQKKSYRVKQYKTKNCKNCPVKNLCTKAKYQKIIERHQYAEALEINKQNIANNPEIYDQRQAIVEHPFGTMKRQWGFDYIITKKSMKRASADVGLIFIAYNLKRIMNIIALDKLIRLFTVFFSFFRLKKTVYSLKKQYLTLKQPKFELFKIISISEFHRKYSYF